jgi:phospholipid/cholesterol/gamma-HCH transport system substrate-binding protein
VAGPTNFLSPLKVGILVVSAAASFGAFLQVISTRGYDSADAYEVSAIFDDVLGLEKKSPVQIAGIDVGRIKDVQLHNGRAKVTLIIQGGVDLYEDATIEKVAISLLGDFKLSLEPGGGKGQSKLVNGGVITNVRSISSMDAMIAEVREMSRSMKSLIAGTPGQPAPLERIVSDVEMSASAARKVLEVVSENIGGNTEKLDDILNNVRHFTKDLSQISSGRDRDVTTILKDSRAIAKALRNTAENLEKIVVGQDQQEISDSVKSLRQTLDTLNRSLDTMASILDKVDRGEGTIGALINDEGIHDGLDETVESINEVLGGVTRMQTWVNLRSEFQFRSGAAKNYVQFVLMPKQDKYYIFEVVDDPRGVRTTVIEDVESTSPETGRSFQYRERKTTTMDGLNFSLQFAKRFYWLSLRFGIIEGTGGVGAGMHFWNDRLEFAMDANQFGIEARRPRMKLLALFEPFKHVYLHGGIDDFLNQGTTDYFMGGGVRFNDEDIKTLLLTSGGIPSTK